MLPTSKQITDKPVGYLNTLQQHIKRHLKKKVSEDAEDTLYHQDYFLTANSFKIETIIDISGIIVAYPFYMLTMGYTTSGQPIHQIEDSFHGQLGTLSGFIGVLCGVSFTSASHIVIKEALNAQERERKLNMMGRMYKHILRALVYNDLNDNNITPDKILVLLNEEIKQTQEALDNMKIFIAQKKALSASPAYSNNFAQREKNEAEIFEDTRTQLVYEQRLKFLEGLHKTVREATSIGPRKQACENLFTKIKEKQYETSRDILVNLHRPTYESIPFDDKIIAYAAPIKEENNNGADVLNDYGVPAARIHYIELLELIAERIAHDEKKNKDPIANINAFGNYYLKGTGLDGFFTDPKAKKYLDHILEKARASAKSPGVRYFGDISADIINKQKQIKPFDDVFNNYGLRASTSHYALLIDLIENLFAHEHPGNNHARWIAIGNHYLKGTVLENFFKHPNAPHLKALFARADEQYLIYRDKRETDSTKIKLDVATEKHTTHAMRQKIHAEDLARDILRKKEEIKFYENKLRIVNPIADAEDNNTYEMLDVNEEDKNPSQATSIAQKNATVTLEHRAVLERYNTQIVDQVKMFGERISDLGDKVGNFFTNMIEGNKPNDELLEENKKYIEQATIGSWFKRLPRYTNSYGYSYKKLVANLFENASVAKIFARAKIVKQIWDGQDDFKYLKLIPAILETVVLAPALSIISLGLFAVSLLPYIPAFFWSEKWFALCHTWIAYNYQRLLTGTNDALEYTFGFIKSFGEYVASFAEPLTRKKMAELWNSESYFGILWSLFVNLFAGTIKLCFNVITLSLFSIPASLYALGFMIYKPLWALINFPTLLKTLKASVDSMHVGVRNLLEALNVTPNDGPLKQILFPIIKPILVGVLSVFEFGFGAAYWLIGPFGKDNSVRKIARAILSESNAHEVEIFCDWMDEKSSEWIILGYDFNVFKYAFYVPLYAFIAVLAVKNWVFTLAKRLPFSIPFIANLVGFLWYTFNKDDVKKHQIARRKTEDFLTTIGTKISVMFSKFFVQPFKNNWGWYRTTRKELDKKYDQHYYGHLDKTKWLIKGIHRFVALPIKVAIITLLNFILGIWNTIASIMAFAPLLTVVSFTTSTVAAGVSIPFIGAIITIDSADTASKLITIPMVLEPMNSTHDLYNNAAYEEQQKENTKLKEPVQHYRKHIRKHLKVLLNINNKDFSYQTALMLLEKQAYKHMPKIPMGEADVKTYIDELISNNKIDVKKAKAFAVDIRNYLSKKLLLKNDCLAYQLALSSLEIHACEVLLNQDVINDAILNQYIPPALITKAENYANQYVEGLKGNNVLIAGAPVSAARTSFCATTYLNMQRDTIAYKYATLLLTEKCGARNTANLVTDCINNNISVESIEELFESAERFEAFTIAQHESSQKIEKHEARTQWSTDCIEYAGFVKRGREKYENDSDLKIKIDTLGHTEQDYKNFLAQVIADQFGAMGAIYLEYLKTDDTVAQALAYFYNQNNIDKTIAGTPEYQLDKKYALLGFSEILVNRLVKIMADDRYRTTLENDTPIFSYNGNVCEAKLNADKGFTLTFTENSVEKTVELVHKEFYDFSYYTGNLADPLYKKYDAISSDKSIDITKFTSKPQSVPTIYYINDNGDALPCETTTDPSTGILTVSLGNDSVQFQPKSFFRISGNSPWLHDRYNSIPNATSFNMNSFIYSEPNNHVDLKLCLEALEKDLVDSETVTRQVPVSSSSSSSSSSASASTAPVTNTVSTMTHLYKTTKHSPISPSAEVIRKAHVGRRPKHSGQVTIAIN